FHTTTIRGTKKEAEQYLNKIVREQDLGTFVDTPAITLNEFIDRWLESVSRIRTSERTSYGHESIFNRYFRNTIGVKKLDKLNGLDIQKVYGEMLGRGLSAQTVRHAHTVLNCALKQAVKWNLLPRNPTEFVELPKVKRVERRVLTAEESRSFIAASKEIKHGLVFEFALLTGMRAEEYLAVQWGDVDFERKSVQVRRALVRHNNQWSFKEPKTSRSRRTVILPASLIHNLIIHKQKQIIQKLGAKEIWEDNDLIFCGQFGTPLSIPNLTYRYFRPILKAAGLPQIRLYDLRHTHATLLLMAEENPKVVAERLGHSTIVLTLDTYSHVLPTMQKRASDKLEKILFG
ncbi:MAG TPA: tyrosine-type recombinase/integrase, partial [Segetibacter sp.]